MGEPVVGEVGERRAAPKAERSAQPAGGAGCVAGGELRGGRLQLVFESDRVDLLRFGAEHIARRACLEWRLRCAAAVCVEELPELRDVIPDLADSGGRGLAAVEILREPFDRDDLVGAQEQDGQHRALPAPAEPDDRARLDHFDRPEDAELQAPHALTVPHSIPPE